MEALTHMWFLAGIGMLLIGISVVIATGGESQGALAPANIALVAAVLSLLVLPAERSARR